MLLFQIKLSIIMSYQVELKLKPEVLQVEVSSFSKTGLEIFAEK